MKHKVKASMWIRSQNKKELVKCIAFSIAKNIGGKKKNAVVGFTSDGFWRSKQIMLGLYESEDLAISELTKVQTELINNTDLYEMN